MRKLKFLLTLALITFTVVAAQGQTSDARKLPADYVSDKCSWFPDGNYGDCCVVHDEAYFFGGTRKERRAVDNKFYECLKGKGLGFKAKMMWLGVRVGGVGFLPTPFRWGFGKNWGKKHPLKK